MEASYIRIKGFIRESVDATEELLAKAKHV